MGKKSREKRERRETFLRQGYSQQRGKIEKVQFLFKEKPFLVKFIFFGISLTLFTPLLLNRNFYFPFVGPKSLFFMAVCQLVFFTWLFLILKEKKYRPKLNSITLALSLFLIVLILSSVFGVDFSRSFWSKYERMTGVLMWLHLFAFFLVISSVFKEVADWKKIFNVSIFVAILVTIAALFEIGGIESFKFSDWGGTTLGNTSFLGTYLLFNFFLAFWLLSQVRKMGWRIYYLAGAGLMFLVIYLAEARAASLATLSGLLLVFLLWLSFRPRSKKIKILGRITLAIFSLGVLISLILLFVPGSFIQQKFINLTSKARFVNWEIAKSAFLEKPLLGWGPENYDLAFTKFFNPCLFMPECGGEIWFDRSHNIVFDTLVTVGIFGFLVYLGLFFSFFHILWRKFFKEKTIDFWTFSIFPACLVTYFIQNLTVFDMVTSLMMFVLLLGFWASLIKKKAADLPVDSPAGPKTKRNWSENKLTLAGIILILVFFFTFSKYVFRPFRTAYLVIESLKAQNFQERTELYQNALKNSPLGKYQIREFFAQYSQDIVKENIGEILKEEAKKEEVKKELDFLIGELEKSIKESPLDYRVVVRLAHLHNTYYLLDPTKLSLAEKYGEIALSLSPTNQQGYWALAQTKALQRNFEAALELCQKAISLEPRWFFAHRIALQITQVSGNIEKAKEIIQKALEINPDWTKEFQEILGD